MSHFITSQDIPEKGEEIKKGALSSIMRFSALLAIVGLLGSFYALFSNNPLGNAPADTLAGRFAYSWLFAFIFFVSLSLGGAFWLLLHHVSNSGWGVSVRRIMEHLAAVFPWMGLLAIPFLFPQVQQHLFEWMNAHRSLEGVSIYGSASQALHQSHHAESHLLLAKYFYLNLPFWLGRMFVYFLLFGACVLWLRSLSLAQDRDNAPGVWRLKTTRRLSAALLPLFALVVTFLSFDLLKGLDYKWFSTMYGVYFFSGCALNGMGVLIVTTYLLRREGYLQKVTSLEHFHIMGKLAFAFVVFWAYVSFSQFFLIWYANITEETRYFLLRNTEGWNVASLVLVFAHFVLPFLFLIRQDVKKNPPLLSAIMLYLFVLHALDCYLIVAPERGPSLTLHSPLGLSLLPHGGVVLLDIWAFMTVGAFFVYFYTRQFVHHSLYPHRDPRILESSNLTN